MSDPNDRLGELFIAYRGACPEVEATAGFMPGVWERIDRRRGFAARVRIWSRALVTVAAGLCLAIGTAEWMDLAPLQGVTYVEVLEDDHAPERLAFVDVVFDPSEEAQ